ncbi:MAG: glycosyltransferase family 2 protein [archaeon]
MANFQPNKYYKDLTIAFSGQNIKHYLILAIESFLYFYPNLKDNIIVFDDNSTDGTREWLEEKSIKTITWSNYTKHYFEGSKKIAKKNNKDNSATKISLIFKEIMYQTKTKYLLLCDGDVIFINNGFVEYFYNIVKDYNIIVPIKQYKLKSKKSIDIYSKYPTQLQINKDGQFYIKGAWSYFSFYNINFLKKYNLLYDNFSINKFNNFYNRDQGIEFLTELTIKNISYYELNKKIINQYILHFAFTVFFNNPIHRKSMPYSEYINESRGKIEFINKILNYKHIKNIFEKYNLRMNYFIH